MPVFFNLAANNMHEAFSKRENYILDYLEESGLKIPLQNIQKCDFHTIS